MSWRWACASVRGTSHIQSGDRLQDACAVLELGHGSILAIVSDGAGSAQFGAYGARILCRFLSGRFRKWFELNSDLPSNEELRHWIDELRDRTSSIAARKGTVARQFAATLAAIVVMPDETITLHIGDSSIVVRQGGKWEVLCWPENGEFASSTYFFTDNPEPRLTIMRHLSNHDAIVLFSDGVGDLALSQLERAAHPGFFDPMINPIDVSSDDGNLKELSAKLALYLAGPAVCERTDDDKTLVLISKRCTWKR